MQRPGARSRSRMKLYDYFRYSASHRVRIVLEFNDLPYGCNERPVNTFWATRPGSGVLNPLQKVSMCPLAHAGT